MKQLTQYLKEEIFTMPATTLGMGNVNFPSQENTSAGSGDVPQPMCIDIKTGKIYKRKKRFRRYKI